MGVLGWGPGQALDTPMPYIHAALEARADYDGRRLRDLQRAVAAVLGVELVKPPPPKTPEEEEAERLAKLRAGLKALVAVARRNEQRQAARAAKDVAVGEAGAGAGTKG